MAEVPPAPQTALHLYPLEDAEHHRFIAVEGELDGAASDRWSRLLRGAVEQRAEGIAIDLRGCRGIDDHCLAALLVAAATLKARGGGVKLVVFPGSMLAHQLRRQVGEELPSFESADRALAALGERRKPVPPLVTLEEADEVVILAVNGEFDLARKDEFREAVDAALAPQMRPLVVDLEHCSFIDSTGIELLVRSSQLAADRGFALAASMPQVHRVLDLVGIPKYLPTYDTRQEAIAAVRS